MAHFVLYKRPLEVATFDFDYSILLPDVDTILDTVKSYVQVFNSAGEDKTSYLITPPITYSVKIATVVIANGLDGEDYSINFYGVGNVSAGKPTPNRILEMRVRKNIAGNL